MAIKLEPEDIVWKLGGKLIDAVDFTIDESSYKNNVAKGSASVVVYGNGIYGGSKTVTFKIGTQGILWWWGNLFN
ncbi:MAG: hypothetical protein J5483_06375 [Lachnospiraceae bacterium]|nr:hypothetical protein [Lachnospiraceae bacterium]